MNHRPLLLLAAAALVIAARPALAVGPADDQLWSALKDGGHVILMRHTITTPGIGDPPGMSIDDCSTQRNLTVEGRRHAKRIGEAMRARGIPIDKVLSSPMCRCLETARLAFDRVDEMSPVASNFSRGEEMPRQVREMRAIAAQRHRGGNVVLVSHGTTIQAVTGIATEPGEMVVVAPQGNGIFELKGKFMPAPP